MQDTLSTTQPINTIQQNSAIIKDDFNKAFQKSFKSMLLYNLNQDSQQLDTASLYYIFEVLHNLYIQSKTKIFSYESISDNILVFIKIFVDCIYVSGTLQLHTESNHFYKAQLKIQFLSHIAQILLLFKATNYSNYQVQCYIEHSMNSVFRYLSYLQDTIHRYEKYKTDKDKTESKVSVILYNLRVSLRSLFYQAKNTPESKDIPSKIKALKDLTKENIIDIESKNGKKTINQITEEYDRIITKISNEIEEQSDQQFKLIQQVLPDTQNNAAMLFSKSNSLFISRMKKDVPTDIWLLLSVCHFDLQHNLNASTTYLIDFALKTIDLSKSLNFFFNKSYFDEGINDNLCLFIYILKYFKEQDPNNEKIDDRLLHIHRLHTQYQLIKTIELPENCKAGQMNIGAGSLGHLDLKLYHFRHQCITILQLSKSLSTISTIEEMKENIKKDHGKIVSHIESKPPNEQIFFLQQLDEIRKTTAYFICKKQSEHENYELSLKLLNSALYNEDYRKEYGKNDRVKSLSNSYNVNITQQNQLIHIIVTTFLMEICTYENIDSIAKKFIKETFYNDKLSKLNKIISKDDYLAISQITSKILSQIKKEEINKKEQIFKFLLDAMSTITETQPSIPFNKGKELLHFNWSEYQDLSKSTNREYIIDTCWKLTENKIQTYKGELKWLLETLNNLLNDQISLFDILLISNRVIDRMNSDKNLLLIRYTLKNNYLSQENEKELAEYKANAQKTILSFILNQVNQNIVEKLLNLEFQSFYVFLSSNFYCQPFFNLFVKKYTNFRTSDRNELHPLAKFFDAGFIMSFHSIKKIIDQSIDKYCNTPQPQPNQDIYPKNYPNNDPNNYEGSDKTYVPYEFQNKSLDENSQVTDEEQTPENKIKLLLNEFSETFNNNKKKYEENYAYYMSIKSNMNNLSSFISKWNNFIIGNNLFLIKNYYDENYANNLENVFEVSIYLMKKLILLTTNLLNSIENLKNINVKLEEYQEKVKVLNIEKFPQLNQKKNNIIKEIDSLKKILEHEDWIVIKELLQIEIPDDIKENSKIGCQIISEISIKIKDLVGDLNSCFIPKCIKQELKEHLIKYTTNPTISTQNLQENIEDILIKSINQFNCQKMQHLFLDRYFDEVSDNATKLLSKEEKEQLPIILNPIFAVKDLAENFIDGIPLKIQMASLLAKAYKIHQHIEGKITEANEIKKNQKDCSFFLRVNVYNVGVIADYLLARNQNLSEATQGFFFVFPIIKHLKNMQLPEDLKRKCDDYDKRTLAALNRNKKKSPDEIEVGIYRTFQFDYDVLKNLVENVPLHEKLIDYLNDLEYRDYLTDIFYQCHGFITLFDEEISQLLQSNNRKVAENFVRINHLKQKYPDEYNYELQQEILKFRVENAKLALWFFRRFQYQGGAVSHNSQMMKNKCFISPELNFRDFMMQQMTKLKQLGIFNYKISDMSSIATENETNKLKRY